MISENGVPTISFLSDYGTADEFVGVVHSVIRSISPAIPIVDITHNIEPFNVRAGSLALARSAAYLMPGVVLAVVDPGVGTDRRPILVEVGDGQSYLVGPDNGLLAPTVALVGGATAAWHLTNTDYHLDSVGGGTFDGRDIFAPVAAHLCAGVPPSSLGEAVDPVSLMPGLLPVSEVGADGAIEAEVLWVDRFGNVQINVEPSQINHWDELYSVTTERTTTVACRSETYARIGAGVGVVTDSQGLVSLAVDRGSAAEELGLVEGDRVTLAAADQPSGVVTPVNLGRTVNRPGER